MKLSIVTTLYCSQKYVAEYHQRMTNVISELPGVGGEYEIIFVDDGSPDDSLKRAIELTSQDPHTKTIELSKNHGHHRAMMIGLEHSVGENVFLIDCDLEEPPESLSGFWAEMTSDNDLDVVYGVQNKKAGNWVRKLLSLAFYRVFNALSYIQIPHNELVCRLMKRNYVEALLQYKEREIFMPGIWIDAGFNRKSLLLEKEYNGDSSYTVAKRVALAIDAVTSFSTRPLLYVFYLGFIVSMLSFLVAVYLVINKIFLGTPLSGWTSILVSLYLIGGVIIFCIGAVGLYLSRIFTEVKQRPLSLVRNTHTHGGYSED